MSERLNESIKDNQAIRDLAHLALEEARRTGHATFMFGDTEIQVDIPPPLIESNRELPPHKLLMMELIDPETLENGGT